MPNRLTHKPTLLTKSNWFVFISGGSILELDGGQEKDASKKREGKTDIRWMASKMMKIEMRIKKMPLANPERVSMRPYP